MRDNEGYIQVHKLISNFNFSNRKIVGVGEEKEEISQEKKNNEQHIFSKSIIPDNTEIVQSLQDFFFPRITSNSSLSLNVPNYKASNENHQNFSITLFKVFSIIAMVSLLYATL